MHPEIKPEAVSFAIKQINDGWIFEEFGQRFLTARFGHEYIPVGGTKDKGIDGLAHTFERKGFSKQIFQLSTEIDALGKIIKTIETLKKNQVKFTNITFLTSRKVADKDGIINNIHDNFEISLRIFDVQWFVDTVGFNEGTKNAYFTFISSHLHSFSVPGQSYVVHKMDTDSRLYVFLRQQLDSKWADVGIDDLLAETLILFALEATDPDKGLFKTEEEIFDSIRAFVKFDPKLLAENIKNRLRALSKKPARKINFYQPENKYCIPYQTRLEITQRNLSDQQLISVFMEQTEAVVKRFLKDNDVNVRSVTELIQEVINRIFYQQGLEFANFVLHGQSQESMEKDLSHTIGITVDESRVILKNKEVVKTALLMAIRHIIYNGTEEQRKYLKCLSSTYMMMFLLQWNPQIALYFESMASKLSIYVCTSIIIPAFSEYYLDEQNKRHWALLKGAQAAGIRLYISDPIIDELVHHFRMLKTKYEGSFKKEESIYLENELQMLYIEEIMLRSYFHAKAQGKVASFYDYINNFCDPKMNNPKDELIDFLKDQFDITYITDSNQHITINKQEHGLLSAKLNEQKKSANKAKTDAKIILSIYKLREKNNESSNAGIFGYKTWWLSKDTTTYLAVQELFKGKYPVSCYIRPDFLYNHIALAPKKTEVDDFYKQVFPSLLGVNISFHLPKEVTTYIQEKIQEHSTKNPSRMKAILRQLTETLQSDPKTRNRTYVKNFFDEELKKHVEGIK